MSLWDAAFFREFVVNERVHKNHNIDKQINFKLVMQRVFYRYFKYVIFRAKKILNLFFFANYFYIKSEEWIFTKWIIKSCDPMHFEKCRWYLNCPLKHLPLLILPFEILFNSPSRVQRHSNSLLKHSKTLFIFSCLQCLQTLPLTQFISSLYVYNLNYVYNLLLLFFVFWTS